MNDTATSKASLNGVFSEYVTGQAFALALSKAMTYELYGFRHFAHGPRKIRERTATLSALERRGLVMHDSEEEEMWHLTRAGAITLALVEESGLVPRDSMIGIYQGSKVII